MSDESYISRVKKLLRLARDKAATPSEASQALNRAMELIDRHKIDVAMLNLDEATEKLVRENIRVGSRVSLIKFLVSNILAGYFNVRICHTRPHIAILGFESDVTIAGYVFDFLVRSCSRAVSEYSAQEKRYRRKMFAAKRENYIRGWMYGVASNLLKQEHLRALPGTSTHLVLSNQKRELDDFFDKEFPRAKPAARKAGKQNQTALTSGWLAGKKTTITTPLDGSEQQTLLLE